MQRIEIRGKLREKTKELYFFYAIGLLVFVNLRSIGLLGCLIWSCSWCGIGFAWQKFMEMKVSKLRIVFEDSGILITDWTNSYRFFWENLQVDELTVYYRRDSKSFSLFAEIGRDLTSHGGSPGTAVKVHEGDDPLKQTWRVGFRSKSYIVLKSKTDNNEFRLPRELISDGDWQDIIGILNLKIASKSESVITQGIFLYAMDEINSINRKQLKQLKQESKSLSNTDDKSLAAYELLVQEAERNRSRLGFSKLYILQGYAKLLEEHGEKSKAESIKKEIDSIKRIAM